MFDTLKSKTMDYKSLLIGALGSALLFVSVGAGINENESSEWQIVERIGQINSFDSQDATTGEPGTFYSWKMLYAKYNVEEGKWIYKMESASFVEPKR